MEKRNPHCSLQKVKALIQNGKVRTTQSARTGAAELGLDIPEIYETVLNLDASDFYKSMTSINDHTIWHDVYKPRTTFGHLYIKLIVINDVLVVSFKEL